MLDLLFFHDDVEHVESTPLAQSGHVSFQCGCVRLFGRRDDRLEAKEVRRGVSGVKRAGCLRHASLETLRSYDSCIERGDVEAVFR